MYDEHRWRNAVLRVQGPWKNSPVMHPLEGKFSQSAIPRQYPGVALDVGVGVGVAAVQATVRLTLA